MDSFKIDLQSIDWTFATYSNDVNLGFEIFLRLFNTTLDKHAPIKEPTKKMGYQRNKKIYVSQRRNLQPNDKGKISANKNRMTQKF